MIRSQRVLMAVGLLVVAGTLHAMLCEWDYHHTSTTRMPCIVGYKHEPAVAQSRGRSRHNWYTGLFAEPDVGKGIAVVFGVITPLVLVALDAYLLLGWRHAARMARGLCPRCGYDLRGTGHRNAGRCPECGWRRAGADPGSSLPDLSERPAPEVF